MWVVPIVLPIILLMVPLGLQVIESRLVRPVQPRIPEVPVAVALEPARPAVVAAATGPTTGSQPSPPRLRAVPQPASAHATAS
jgi:hypothetical protein